MSGSNVGVYSPDRVTILVSGVPITGFADGTFCEIAPNVDLSTMQVGADGEVAISVSSNKTVAITITLQQISPSNDYLSTLIQLGDFGFNVFPVSVIDLRGRTVFESSQCWISQRPTITFAQEVSERAWQIMSASPSVWFAGGNVAA